MVKIQRKWSGDTGGDTYRRQWISPMTGGGGYITMRPWRHQQTLPPPQRDWFPPVGRPPADYTQRMAEPAASGGGPGNPFAGRGPYYPYGPYQGPIR
jgi:hypothetical protein